MEHLQLLVTLVLHWECSLPSPRYLPMDNDAQQLLYNAGGCLFAAILPRPLNKQEFSAFTTYIGNKSSWTGSAFAAPASVAQRLLPMA